MFKGLTKVLCASLVLSSVMPAGVMADDFSDDLEESVFFEEDVDFDDEVSDVTSDDFASEDMIETELDTEDVFEAESEVLIEEAGDGETLFEGEQLICEGVAEIKYNGQDYYYHDMYDVIGGTYRFRSYSDKDTEITVRDIDTNETFYADDDGADYNFNLVCVLKDGHNYEITINFHQSNVKGSIPYKIFRIMKSSVIYDANGGTGAPEEQEVMGSGPVALSTVKPKKYLTVTFNGNGGKVDPTSGKVSLPFTKWTTYPNGSGQAFTAGATLPSGGNWRLFAQYAKSAAIGNMPTPQRAGYIFDGWYTAKSGGTKVTSSTMISANMTVYAHWKQDTKSYGNTVQGFVYRLYRNVLNRDAEPSGMSYWVNQLTSGKKNGAEAADGFIHSTEFEARALSDATYIEILYNTFLNRSSDSSGMSYWLDKLNNGMSRDYVFAGFVNSTEFTKICNQYGIKPGNVKLTEARDQNEGVTRFIYRCYDKFLGRKADAKGLNYWCDLLLSGKNDAKEVAEGFVYSTEFQCKNMTNEMYIKTLYQGLFNRNADSVGFKSWDDMLWAGLDRHYVFYGFADSNEFRKLAQSFNLNSNWANSKCDKVYFGDAYTLIIPAEWDGKYTIVKAGPTLKFCEKTNYSYMKTKYNDTAGGMMFAVYPAATKEEMYVRSEYKGFSGMYHYYIFYPSDVRYEYTDKTLSANYVQLYNQTDGVVSTFLFRR